MLFESICNSQWFIHTSIILFLNKIDLFKQKLPTSPVKKYFPDYAGDPKSYKQASGFFEENFKRLNRNASKVSLYNCFAFQTIALTELPPDRTSTFISPMQLTQIFLKSLWQVFRT